LVLKDVKLMNILKNTLDVDSDIEIVKMFVYYDNTITKSKYVTKYINSLKK